MLRLLWHGELAAGAIHQAMSDVTFGAVSLHLSALRRAGLVQVREAGRHRFYRVDPQRRREVGRILEPMWRDALWRLKLTVELEESRRGPRPQHRKRRPRTRTTT